MSLETALLGALQGGSTAVADIAQDNRKRLADEMRIQLAHDLEMIKEKSRQGFEAGQQTEKIQAEKELLNTREAGEDRRLGVSEAGADRRLDVTQKGETERLQQRLEQQKAITEMRESGASARSAANIESREKLAKAQDQLKRDLADKKIPDTKAELRYKADVLKTRQLMIQNGATAEELSEFDTMSGLKSPAPQNPTPGTDQPKSELDGLLNRGKAGNKPEQKPSGAVEPKAVPEARQQPKTNVPEQPQPKITMSDISNKKQLLPADAQPGQLPEDVRANLKKIGDTITSLGKNPETKREKEIADALAQKGYKGNAHDRMFKARALIKKYPMLTVQDVLNAQ